MNRQFFITFSHFLPFLLLFTGCKKEITENHDSSSQILYLEAGDQIKLRSVEKTADGGFIYAGIQDEDAFLLKVDANGSRQWYKTFGGKQFDEFHHAIATKDGGIIAVGYSNSFGSDLSLGKVSGYAVKTDASGNLMWEKTYKHSNVELSFRSVTENPAGGFAVTGMAYYGTAKLNLISLDASGNMVFSRIYTDYSAIPPLNIARNYISIGLSVLQPGNGKIILGAIMSKSNFVSEVNDMMPTLMETSGNGTPVALYRNDNEKPGNWYFQKVMLDKRRNIGLKILALPDGYLFATSFEYPGQTDPIVIRLIKTDASGNLMNPIWKKEYRGLGNALFLNVNDNGDGTFLVCGSSTSGSWNFSCTELFNGLKSMVFKVDGNGNEIWTQYYGSNINANMALCAQSTGDGQITVAGLTSLNESIFNKMYWMKLNADGLFQNKGK